VAPRTPRAGARESAPALIVGGGHAGLLVALALERAASPCVVLDRLVPHDVLCAPFDGRALALMYGSKRILEALGVWERIASDATPVWGVRVHDQATDARIVYDAAEVGDHPFAFGIENRRLRARLLEQVLERESIELAAPAALARLERTPETLIAGLDSGEARSARLVIGADGRDSAVRALAGIGVERGAYAQTALTFAIRHERPHAHMVREFLRPAGPLALLPIAPDLCSITWIERRDTARHLLAGSREGLRIALLERIGDVLGDLEIEGEPAGYPLSWHRARRYVGPRVALLGDAAHGLHPIHAQGFNLGVRDVATLAEVLTEAGRAGEDPGSAEVLLRYEARRRGDVNLVLGLTDGLNRLFSNDLTPAKLLRGLALTVLDNLSPLKHEAMRRGMGLAGDLPRLAHGEPL